MQKIRTATFTFHASHNYGSMLQAYALQQVLIKEIGVDNEIINFRSDAQKSMYKNPTSKKKGWKQKVIKNIIGNNDKELTKKYQLFEDFIKEKLIISHEINSEKDIVKYIETFDFLIAGSDQIWNVGCRDFNWIYFLPFAKNNAIAYAPSMGPRTKDEVKEEYYSQIKEYLQQFHKISVRECCTADIIKSIADIEVETMIDPTLLVYKDAWDKLSGNEPIINGEYVFLYQPFIGFEICKISQEISKRTNIPIVISNKIPSIYELKQKVSSKKRLQYRLDTGPIEFLNLLKNAKFVISGSFHAVVFSIIFNKPFLALHGKTDDRISQLLKSTGLMEYAVDSDNYMQVMRILNQIQFSEAEAYIEKERNKSLSFLRNAMNCK